MRKANIITGFLFATSALILIATLFFTLHIQILKDWKIIVPNTQIHAGDTIVIRSEYTKLRPVTGVATRYLDCNTHNGIIRYPVNLATANRAPAVHTGTGIILKIPDNIPELPAKCRVSIVVKYKVYPWRTVTEFNSSNQFTLLPPTSSATVSAVSSAPTQSSQPQTSFVSQSSSSNNTSKAPTTQPNTSQPSDNSQPVSQPAQPSFIQQITNPITNLVKGIL